MKEYVYVFDYSTERILRITIDEKDKQQQLEEDIYDIDNILRRRGLKEIQCAYLFSEKVLEIENAELV